MSGVGKRGFWAWFKTVRVALLLTVFAVVAWTTWSSDRRLRSWDTPFTIGIYPMQATSDVAVVRTTESLTEESFEPMKEFLVAEARRRGRRVDDLVRLKVMPAIADRPPPVPPRGASAWEAVSWSLSLRAWAFQTKRRHGFAASDIELYVRFNPPSARPDLDLSAGIPQGHLGVIETEAGERALGWTLLATTHELLHTLGAPDTYGADGLPVIPEGLAEPDLRPLFPQKKCEIMSGQIALSPEKALPAQALSECQIGESTAGAIGW